MGGIWVRGLVSSGLGMPSKIIHRRLSKVSQDVLSEGRVINNSSDYLFAVVILEATIKVPISFAASLYDFCGIVDPFLGALWVSMWVVLKVGYVAHGS